MEDEQEQKGFDFDSVVVQEDHARSLWFALFGVCHAIEQLELDEQVNQLVENNTGLGAFHFAKAALFHSMQNDEE